MLFFYITITFSFICISYFIFFDINHPIIYAQKDNENVTKIHTVTIPNGAANPSVDITNFEERKWYLPSKIEINSGDVVKWINNDRESHTVTSGKGSGIQSLLTNKLGTPDGLFDSGLFGAGDSWAYNFTNKKGIFTYFCTLHPWMTGAVQVTESTGLTKDEEGQTNKMKNSIPQYPVDAQGNKLSRFPVHTFTDDGKYDIDMGWSPRVLTTNTQSTFLIDFFEMPSNTKAHLLPFDFVIVQNNKTLEETSSIANVGADALKYTFSNPGPVTIRIENVGNNPSYTEFNTLVYSNTNLTSVSNSENQYREIISPVSQFSSGFLSPIFLVTLTYSIIFLIPAAVGVIIFLYKKGKI